MTQTGHRWRFFRAGAFDQPLVERGDDFARLGELDQELWAVLACPVQGLEIDERTLALMDLDADGRVRAPEVVAAGRWCAERLRDLDGLTRRTDRVALAAIDDTTEAGAELLAAARRVVSATGRTEADAVTLVDVESTATAFAAQRLNGDGVVPAESAEDEALAAVIAEVVGALGGVEDRSGATGVDADTVTRFFEAAAERVAWADRGREDEALRPLGDDTDAAVATFRVVAEKVDDYFARAALAAYDARAVPALNRGVDALGDTSAQDLSLDADELAELPLALVSPGAPLPLVQGVHPAWAARVHGLRDRVVRPLLGEREELSAADWRRVREALTPRLAWQADEPAPELAGLEVERLRELLSGDVRSRLEALVESDAARASEFEELVEVERLVRYHRDLDLLVRNFVNLGDFYASDRLATFQTGTLFMDGRKCLLVLGVADVAKHAALAVHAATHLAYLRCTRKSGETRDVVAGFTDGDSDYLMVGRNGVFYDRAGRDWDATVTRVVEHPISIREAFWAPYKRLVRAIEDLAAKRAAAREQATDRRLSDGAGTAADAAGGKAAPVAPKIDTGTVAAMGVAAGMIGIFLTTLIGYLTGLFQQPFWIVCLVVVGVLLLISGPSMLIAWLKLRRRSLAPILDAGGWAVNARARMTVRFGKSLTKVATLPDGATVTRVVGATERVRPLPLLFGLVVAACFLFSLLNHFGLVHLALVEAFGVDPSELSPVLVRPF